MLINDLGWMPPPPPKAVTMGQNQPVPPIVPPSSPPAAPAHDLTWPQYDFVTSTARFPALVAGFGAGKTEAAIVRAITLKIKYPKNDIGYYLPTYDLIQKIAFPRFEQLFAEKKFVTVLNETKKEMTVVGMQGKIIFRSMDTPESIIGYEVADSIADELDVLKIDKAADIWRKIVARNRQKKPDGSPNTIGVATTPEGFKFVYEKWKKNPMEGSQLIKASTSSNPHLPPDYVQTLKDTYPDHMLAAYLEGEFVNLTAGSVYFEFDRRLNAAPASIAIKPAETLHIGFDFNVGKMAAVVHILRDGEPIAVDEFVGYLDTPALIKAIEKRYPGHRIFAYPDASGKNRKSNNAAESDIVLLKQAKFMVLAKSVNPFVRDRVAAFNKLIHKNGKRVYKVNIDACPHLVEGLEKQAYDKHGEPDKTSGFDHVIDAAGYFVSYRFPILHGKARQTKVSGV